MRHRIKKIKLKKGKNAKMVEVRKLLVNFVRTGKIETTQTRAKLLKSLIDRLVYKAQDRKKSNENILFKYFGSADLVEKMFNLVGPELKDKKSGFVKIIRTGVRVGDGAQMIKVEWVKPVIETKSADSELKIVKRKKEKVKNAKSNKINKISKRKRN